MLLEPDKVDNHHYFAYMFEAQHFPLKIPTNEFTFDLVSKKIDGKFGDDHLKDYKFGPIGPTGGRIRIRDCRKEKKKIRYVRKKTMVGGPSD